MHIQVKPPSRNFPKGGYEVNWRDGGRFKSKTFRSKREAEQFMATIVVSKRDGTYVDPARSRTMFAEVADDWFQTASRSLKPKTLLGYESVLRTHVLPYWKGYQVGAIDFDAINGWVTKMTKAGKSASVIRGSFKVLRLILGHAVKGRKLAHNPANRDITLPPQASGEMHFLTASEVELLAGAFPRPEQRLLVLFAAYTGLRAGEIGALKLRNLTLGADPSVSVVEAISDVNGHLITGAPKTDAGRRTVPLPGFLATELAHYLTTIDPDAYVFTAAEGGQLRHNNFMKRFWRRAVTQSLPAHLHSLRFHDLRHTFASLMIAEGAHPKELQELMGHSTITVTLDRYGHVFPQRRSDLARLLDARRAEASRTDPEPSAEVVGLR